MSACKSYDCMSKCCYNKDEDDEGDPGEIVDTEPVEPPLLGGQIGATGPQGNVGIDGPEGIKGDKGDAGIQGPQGVKGDTGI